MRTRRLLRAVVAVSVVAATLAACEDDDAPARPGSAYDEVACPDDVESVVLAVHTCGTVDVGEGSRLFVVQVDPPRPSGLSPVIETGTDLGTAPDYAGLAPIAQRTGRPLVLVDLRGTGHSTPSFDCPEVDATAADVAGGAAGARARLTAGVRACRERLTASGAAPGSVDLRSTAHDLHTVQQALGHERAVVSAHGTTGLVALEWARRHPTDLEAMVLDTPLLGGAVSDRRLDREVSELTGLCAATTTCRRRHPGIGRAWRDALAAVGAGPAWEVMVRGTRVLLDEAAARRAVRWAMAGGSGIGPSQVPALVADLRDRHVGGLVGRHAELLVSGPPLCFGWLPKCGGPRVAMGAVLSLACPVLGDEPAWRPSCRAWGPTSAAEPRGPITVPTLVLTGRYDPFAPAPSDVRALLSRVVPGAFFVEDPVGGHNVLGNDCLRSVRTSWLNGDVGRPPPRPRCLDERALDLD